MTHSKKKKMAFQYSSKRKGKAATLVASVGLILGVVTLPDVALAKGKGNTDESHLTYIEELGKRLFFENLSDPKRQSCSNCHLPAAGGTNGVSGVNLHQVAVTGANPHTVGGIKPPTNKYVAFLNKDGKASGLLSFGDCTNFPARGGLPRGIPSGFCGGAFWDGRATGGQLLNDDEEKTAIKVYAGLDGKYDYESLYKEYEENPVTHQAHASPFINPVEQGLASKTVVCEMVESTKWGAELYEYAWGTPLNCNEDIDRVFARFAIALGAWQLSEENNNFTSKRDDVIRKQATFTKEEQLGQDLFYGRAGCAFICHQSDRDGKNSLTERYTDDSFHNVGFPGNHEIPNNPTPSIGLESLTGDPGHRGFQKTPTLRNVDQRPGNGFIKAYTHSGWFKTLEGLVHFYNTGAVVDPNPDDGRDITQTAQAFGKTRCPDNNVTEKQALSMNCWPEPEYFETSTVALGFVGNLGLTLDEEAALVAYLKTFTDKEYVTEPKPYKSSPVRDPNRMSH